MPLRHKGLDAITEADLQGLIDGAVREGRRIEYKRELPGGKDKDKHEFRADVSSFANAGGGDLIYGVVDVEGAPVEICGLPGTNPDAEILRLEQTARAGIDPRIPGMHCRAVPVDRGDQVIIMRVPRSWSLPHVVVVNDSYRFYSRTSNGKYILDVRELRAIFAMSENEAERIRRFRDQRLATIVANEGPVELDGTARLILHIVPFAAPGAGPRIDVRALQHRLTDFYSFSSGIARWRYNLDGMLTIGYSIRVDRPPASYLQVFRDGSVEAVEAGMLICNELDRMIPGATFDRDVVDCVRGNLDALRSLGIEPPFVVLLALTGVRRYRLAAGFTRIGLSGHRIDRDVVIAPEVLVDDDGIDPAATLRPARV